MTDIVTTKSGNTLLNLHYNFDNVGNILSVQDNARGETTNYAYDDLDRLLSASVATGGNQYNRSWTYDALGNMQTRVENGATTNYSYDPNHKHAVASAGGATYQYDANGNLTNRNGDALTYDAENHLTSVVKGGVTTSFGYNGDRTRVKRSVSNAGTTYYVGNYFEVWVPNSGTTTFNKYYYFGAARGGENRGNFILLPRRPSRLVKHRDDASGNVVLLAANLLSLWRAANDGRQRVTDRLHVHRLHFIPHSAPR